MPKKKTIALFALIIICALFMTTYAGEPEQAAKKATREVVFTDGMTGKDIANYEVEVGKSVKEPLSPYHHSYVFIGWYQFDNRDEKVESFDKIIEDVHVIAIYKNDVDHNGIADDEDEYFNKSTE